MVGATVLIAAPPAVAEAPQRVVSINLCTDQLAMLLAGEGQLVSVSRIALDQRVSAMASEALHYVINAGRAEEVHVMRPDLVVAGVYTSRDTIAMLRRLGIEVVQFDIVKSLDQVRTRILEMGDALEQQEAARVLVARFDADLAALREEKGPLNDAPRAALYYANGYTSGENSLATDILHAAGLRNAPAEAGYDWRRYPGGRRAEEVMDHPVVGALRGRGAALTDQDWVCGTPFVLRAIRDMVDARRSVDATKAEIGG